MGCLGELKVWLDLQTIAVFCVAAKVNLRSNETGY